MATVRSVNIYDYVSYVDPTVANIQAAMNRSKLTGLNKTKVLKQKLLNDGYHYPMQDKPVCYFDSTGKPDADIIVAFGVDKRDGSILTTEVDSSFFEVI